MALSGKPAEILWKGWDMFVDSPFVRSIVRHGQIALILKYRFVVFFILLNNS
jgi:hypothetical protein